ncbi:glycerophosphodiester phosphodiesterase [Paramicrobacterium chengjingii]|uniref:glycerophosphodiester phosphodiesterase n=1 Tax=Paramicrobacterium chengjingii TaxID=2769067 RepID=UPI00141EB9B7
MARLLAGKHQVLMPQEGSRCSPVGADVDGKFRPFGTNSVVQFLRVEGGSSVANGVRLVAHRGLHDEEGGHARENTVEAVRDALEVGATWVEVDVRVTQDGAAVLLHDATLDRLWGDSRAVSDVTLAEVQELSEGEHRIPLLGDILTALDGGGATLLIDMDSAEPAIGSVRVVQASTSNVATAWCGDIDAMRTIREIMPEAVVWMPWHSSTPPMASEIAFLSPSAINVKHTLVGQRFVDEVHTLGVDVAVWTVDETPRALHLASIGVDSITSNRFEAIAEATRAEANDRS